MPDMQEPELIARSLDGDSNAYAELVDRYKNAVYYHIFAIVRDADIAEDIAQETFISAYYNLKKYNSEYRLSTWLFKISTNKCLNHINRYAKETTLDDKTVLSIASAHPLPHAEAEYSELHRAVQRLEPKYRAVISLYYWQGLDYAATAQAMGVPLNSVRVWLMRAKDELRKELA